MKLATLSTGDSVYRYYKSIVIEFAGPRQVLSTSVHNGGIQRQLQAVFNQDCNPGAGLACTLKAPTYEEHLRIIAAELGLDPARSSGMSTAASMDNVAIEAATYRELTVTALVTAGIDVNGGRVGDVAHHYLPIDKDTLRKPGTINMIVVIDADLPPGTLAKALITCTEAKVAALQELLAGSNYSQGVATGSGTDSVMVVSNPSSPLYLEDAGQHGKLGELLGKTVKQALKTALYRQTGLDAARQHHVLERLRRFQITQESCWLLYCQTQEETTVSKACFLAALEQVARKEEWVVQTSLYVHLLDQVDWGLLTIDGIQPACRQLLAWAEWPGALLADTPAALMHCWQEALVAGVRKCLQAKQE